MSEEAFTKFMKRKEISNGIIIIALIIAWVCGFLWKGLYM